MLDDQKKKKKIRYIQKLESAVLTLKKVLE